MSSISTTGQEALIKRFYVQPLCFPTKKIKSFCPSESQSEWEFYHLWRQTVYLTGLEVQREIEGRWEIVSYDCFSVNVFFFLSIQTISRMQVYWRFPDKCTLKTHLDFPSQGKYCSFCRLIFQEIVKTMFRRFVEIVSNCLNSVNKEMLKYNKQQSPVLSLRFHPFQCFFSGNRNDRTTH